MVSFTMREPFTAKRRDLLAKTLMDLAKIFVAAALASNLFGKLPIWLRLSLLATIFGLLMAGMQICPKHNKED